MYFKKRYESNKPTKGTVQKMKNPEDKANQSHKIKTDIKEAIKIYGMIPESMVVPDEKLYISNIDDDLTLNERLQRDEYYTDYFYNLNPKLRKEYNDNPHEFITDIILNKNIEKCRKLGIISQEIYDNYNSIQLEKANKIQEKENYYKNLEKTNKNLQQKINEFTMIQEQKGEINDNIQTNN